MARCATDILVRPLQCKSRLAMIKWLRVTPFHDRMTAVAPLTKPTTMRIGLLVTFKTDGGSFTKLDFRRVAALAGHIPMGIDKLVIGEIVVESFAIQLVDVGATPLVVSMTLFALPRQCLPLSSVNTKARGTVGSHILVAIKAKFRL
jgi:hypothetical protein